MCVCVLCLSLSLIIHTYTHSINASNKAFKERVSSAKGAIELMQVIGFKAEAKTSSGPVSVFADPSAHLEAIILPSHPSDDDRLRKVYNLLFSATETLGIPADEVPKLRNNSTSHVMLAAAPPAEFEFDPMKPLMYRTVPSGGTGSSIAEKKLVGGTGPSITEQKLEQLQKRRRELEGSIESVERNTEVLYPRANGSVPELTRSLGSEEEDSEEDHTGDKGTLMKSFAKKISARPADEAPLVTKAIRDLEKAKREKVYTKTLIRIRFPNKVLVCCLSSSISL